MEKRAKKSRGKIIKGLKPHQFYREPSKIPRQVLKNLHLQKYKSDRYKKRKKCKNRYERYCQSITKRFNELQKNYGFYPRDVVYYSFIVLS